MQATGYRSKPMLATVKLNQAFTDLAVDSSLAYHTFLEGNPDSTIDILFYESRWASRINLECWYHYLQNMRLAYRLGYLDLINWGGADWINDCCDFFRDDHKVASWFRERASVYVATSNVKLPKMGEVWGNSISQVEIVSVQPNHVDESYYNKEMLVLFDTASVERMSCDTLLRFITEYRIL